MGMIVRAKEGRISNEVNLGWTNHSIIHKHNLDWNKREDSHSPSEVDNIQQWKGVTKQEDSGKIVCYKIKVELIWTKWLKVQFLTPLANKSEWTPRYLLPINSFGFPPQQWILYACVIRFPTFLKVLILHFSFITSLLCYESKSHSPM
jgi:hypothetical protein